MKRPEVWFVIALLLVIFVDALGRDWALNNLANPRLGHPLVVDVNEPGHLEAQLIRRFGSLSGLDASAVRDLDGRPFDPDIVLSRGQKIVVPEREVVWATLSISFRLVFNKGATFGLQLGGFFDQLLRGLIGAFGVGVCLWAFKHTRRARQAMALAMGVMWGGAIGNLISRLKYGYVVDFIAFDRVPVWPVFNLADTAITLGAVVVAMVALLQPKTKSLDQAQED